MSESICVGCTHRDYCKLSDFNYQGEAVVLPVSSCFCFKEAKQTNADRIRSMSDEELANWWAFMQVAYDFNDPQKTLEWLKEEVEE